MKLSGRRSYESLTDNKPLKISFAVNCEAGFYRNAYEEVCQVCKGKTVSEAGASICTECPEGTEANAEKTQCGQFIIKMNNFYHYLCKFETKTRGGISF